jgi:hypothetical protein
LNVGTCIAQASNVVGFKAPIKSQSTKWKVFSMFKK